MSAGGQWVAGTDSDSAARLNQKTVTIDTGTNLAGMAATYAGQLIFSTDTSGGFTTGTMYQRNASNSGWVTFLPMTIHDHSTTNALTGGLFSDVMSANTGQVIYNEMLSPKTSYFFTSTTGGTITDDIAANQWRVKLDTGIVANNYAQADVGGIRIDFGSKIKFQAKVEQQTATIGLQCRIGVNNEKSNAVVDATTKSLGFEFCDSTGTTYQLESCDGTTRTVTNTTQPFNGAHAIKFLYTPSTNVVGTIDQTVATTKTTNLPNSGQVLQDRIMRFGIQTTNTTVKDLYIYGAVLVAVPLDIWF